MGFLGAALKVQVAAPAEGWKANDAVLTLLADLVGVPRKEVELVTGHASPRKTVAFPTLTPDALTARLAAKGFPPTPTPGVPPKGR